MTGREQRTVFGEVAADYHDVRPGYPERLVDDVLAFAGVEGGGSVLEVGAGTGKATAAFAARGLPVLGLEPSEDMAAVARETCAAYPGVSFVVSSFEAWAPPQDTSFDLLISAQAWHWVDPAIAYRKAQAVLAPRGALALFWNRPARRDPALRAELDEVYLRIAPSLSAREPGFRGDAARVDAAFAEEIVASGRFAAPSVRAYDWFETYTPERYARLLTTQSNHRMLPPGRLAALVAGVRERLEGRAITIDYRTQLFLARVAT